MTDVDYEDRTRAPDNGAVRQAAGAALDSAGTAVSDTAGTAKEQARQVGGEAKVQARNLARDVKDRVSTEARTQNDRLADSVRRFADELDEMVGVRGDSPASKVVTQVSQGGRRVADYLAEHGPEGVLEGVQDFARRKPGTFLAVAAAAGFVVGRLGKGVFNAESTEGKHAYGVANTETYGTTDTYGTTGAYSGGTGAYSPGGVYSTPPTSTVYAEEPYVAGTDEYAGTTSYAGTTGAAVPNPVTPSTTAVTAPIPAVEPDSELRNARP